MKRPIFLFILCLLMDNSLQAQRKGEALIDSLQTVLQAQKDDTNRVNDLNALSVELWRNRNSPGAKQYAEEAIALSEKIKFIRGKASAYLFLGNINQSEYNPKEALKDYKIALDLFEVIGNKKGMAQCYLAIGKADYYNQYGSSAEALKNYFLATKLFEELNDKRNIAECRRSIAEINVDNGDDSIALMNLTSVLQIFEEVKDSERVAYTLNFIGQILFNQRKYSEASERFYRAYAIYEALGSRGPTWGIAWTYSYLGRIKKVEAELAYASGDMKTATQKFHEALNIFELRLKLEMEGNMKSTDSYFDIADLRIRMMQVNVTASGPAQIGEAKKCLTMGLQNSLQYHENYLVANTYQNLSTLDSMQGNFAEAFRHFKLYKLYQDSASDEESAMRTTRLMMQNDFDKRESDAQAEQEEKDIKQRNIRNSIAAGLGGTLIFLLVVYRQRNKISKARKRSDELLLNILPEETAEELKTTGTTEAKSFDEVTVMFTDFKNFTQASEKMDAKELVGEINFLFSEFDKIISKHNIEKIKTIGDSYMCAGGLPVANKTNATDVVNAALEIQNFMFHLKAEREKENKYSFEIRIGIHTGPVVAGIVGIKKFAYDIWGDTVNIASRMESSGEAGKVNISGATYEVVKEKFNCVFRGKIPAKNKGDIDMYFVEGA